MKEIAMPLSRLFTSTISVLKKAAIVTILAVCIPFYAKAAYTDDALSTTYYEDTFVDYDPTQALIATEQFYASLVQEKPNLAMLQLFMSRMPKGGDLHNHYMGSIYAETFLDIAQQKGLLIDKCTLQAVKKPGKCAFLTVEQLLKDDYLYKKLLASWSVLDYDSFYSDIWPKDYHFFSTFYKFPNIGINKNGLQVIKQRAIAENVYYIETILHSPHTKAVDYFSKEDIAAYNKQLRNASSQQEVDLLLGKISTVLTSNKLFDDNINSFLNNLAKSHKTIDTPDFMMRYQVAALRILDPIQVFTDLLSGHIASDRSPLIPGVNIVGPENHPTAVKDYTLHMRMYAFLFTKYPDVKKSLHAGELTLGIVSPMNLTFHIKQAMDIAGAHRIGHGVDVPYETDALELLKDLKQNAVIEIALTSNEFILGVSNKAHPYMIYSSYGVPMVIATDDSGVSRDNLAHQYVLLASRYAPSYKQIKEYVYNSIDHSFLMSDEKTYARSLLDRKFLAFEQDIANLRSRTIKVS